MFLYQPPFFSYAGPCDVQHKCKCSKKKGFGRSLLFAPHRSCCRLCAAIEPRHPPMGPKQSTLSGPTRDDKKRRGDEPQVADKKHRGDELPTDILKKIFAHLPERPRWVVLSLVCKRWRQVLLHCPIYLPRIDKHRGIEALRVLKNVRGMYSVPLPSDISPPTTLRKLVMEPPGMCYCQDYFSVSTLQELTYIWTGRCLCLCKILAKNTLLQTLYIDVKPKSDDLDEMHAAALSSIRLPHLRSISLITDDRLWSDELFLPLIANHRSQLTSLECVHQFTGTHGLTGALLEGTDDNAAVTFPALTKCILSMGLREMNLLGALIPERMPALQDFSLVLEVRFESRDVFDPFPPAAVRGIAPFTRSLHVHANVDRNSTSTLQPPHMNWMRQLSRKCVNVTSLRVPKPGRLGAAFPSLRCLSVLQHLSFVPQEDELHVLKSLTSLRSLELLDCRSLYARTSFTLDLPHLTTLALHFDYVDPLQWLSTMVPSCPSLKVLHLYRMLSQDPAKIAEWHNFIAACEKRGLEHLVLHECPTTCTDEIDARRFRWLQVSFIETEDDPYVRALPSMEQQQQAAEV